MDWQQAINRQHEHLVRIVAMLFAMLGLDEDNPVSRLSRPLHRAVLRILYPAESAVRRLIFVMARGLVAKLPTRRPVPQDLSNLPRQANRPNVIPALRREGPPSTRNLATSSKKTDPRIHVFSEGRLVTILGRSPFEPAPEPDTTINATQLCRRLFAIRSALENLPREARRLSRWRARSTLRPPEKFRKPLRRGRPPGHREKPELDVDDVLKDCQWLAFEAAKLDTS